jgi:(1->4)-alpha-D-glucan 1-alpha-D-glucosylmutase
VLADAPEVWARSVKRWQRWNARCKRVLNGLSVPGPNAEYFIYQTLAGAWPLDPAEMETFVERLQTVLVKSWREAKLYTSWNNTDRDYEAAIAEFVTTILTPVAENHFLPDFVKFQQHVAASGACLSLAQTVLRIVSPGVPDIYQGAELWELSMVDPDNRRPVDFAKRQSLLEDLQDRDGPELLKNWQCGSVKQYVIQKALNLRREHPEVFRTGEYIPMDAIGHHAANVIAFARHSGMAWTIAVAPRCPVNLSKPSRPSLRKGALADTDLAVPPNAPRRWFNLFTGENIEVSGTGRMAAEDVLGHFPIALLTAIPE